MKIRKEDRPLFFVLLFLGITLLINAICLWHGQVPSIPQVHNGDTGFLGVTSDGWVAIFTFVLAIFTLGLWMSSVWQGWLTRQSINLARTEFVSTHRPRVILRAAYTSELNEGEHMSVHLIFANTGETNATIRSTFVQVIQDTNETKRLSLDATVGNSAGRMKHLEGAVIQPGAWSMLGLAPASNPVWEEKRFGLVGYMSSDGSMQFRPKIAIQLVGNIEYSDDNGIIRRTAFRRVLAPMRERFVQIEGETELDYAD